MIRLARLSDLDLIMELVKDAQTYLKKRNIPQWQNNYPNRDILSNDIASKSLYLYLQADKLIGMINISLKKDSQYDEIYNGAWLNDNPYAVVHRLAVKEKYLRQGIASLLLLFSEEVALANNITSIRIDTHKENEGMRHLLEKLDYKYCGVIILDNKDQSDYYRLAYEKVIKKR